jgi:DNA modification methylase
VRGVPSNQILVGDALETLRTLPADSVHCVVTSPPYWGLRDYGVAGQIGLEDTPEAFVDRLVAVFREVRRVLRADGTAWINMGDSYAQDGGFGKQGKGSSIADRACAQPGGPRERRTSGRPPLGLKPKDLIGQPWRLAFALQADGWWLRSDIIWAKPNPMPESVTDRPTRAHEYLFLLAKSESYYYDADAVREPYAPETATRAAYGWQSTGNRLQTHQPGTKPRAETEYTKLNAKGRNRRSVWPITTVPFSEAHFATFPEKLVEPCILAGCPKDGIVLDPFMGAGTVALVALKAGRRFLGVELNPKYAAMARARIAPELAQGRLA